MKTPTCQEFKWLLNENHHLAYGLYPTKGHFDDTDASLLWEKAKQSSDENDTKGAMALWRDSEFLIAVSENREKARLLWRNMESVLVRALRDTDDIPVDLKGCYNEKHVNKYPHDMQVVRITRDFAVAYILINQMFTDVRESIIGDTGVDHFSQAVRLLRGIQQEIPLSDTEAQVFSRGEYVRHPQRAYNEALKTSIDDLVLQRKELFATEVEGLDFGLMIQTRERITSIVAEYFLQRTTYWYEDKGGFRSPELDYFFSPLSAVKGRIGFKDTLVKEINL